MRYSILKKLFLSFVIWIACFFSLGAQTEGLDSLRQLLARLSQKDTNYVLILCQIAGAELFFDPIAAQKSAETCLEKAEDLKYPNGQIFALNILGIATQRAGRFPEALELYLRAIRLAETTSNQGRLVKTLNNLGLLYYNAEDYEKALEQFQRALSMQKDPLEIANLRTNVGLTYKNTNRSDLALAQFHQALATYLELGYDRGIASSYNNISLIYLEKNDLEQSLANLQLALPVFRRSNLQHGEATVLNNIGRVLTQQRRFVEAKPYLRQGLALSQRVQNLKFQVEATQHMHRFFQVQGHVDSAYHWLQRYQILKDSFTNVQQREEVEAIKQRYANEQKLVLMQKDAALQRTRLLVWRGGALFLLLLLGLGAYAFWLAQRRRTVSLALQRQEMARLEMAEENQRLQSEKLSETLEFKSRELAFQTMSLIQKNELLQTAASRLREIVGNEESETKRFRPILRLLENSAHSENQWETFKQHFEAVHTNFFQKLLTRQPNLTAHDLRYCAYLRINLTSKEIAALLGASLRSVETHRYRLRKKLALDSEIDLVSWIMQV